MPTWRRIGVSREMTGRGKTRPALVRSEHRNHRQERRPGFGAGLIIIIAKVICAGSDRYVRFAEFPMRSGHSGSPPYRSSE